MPDIYKVMLLDSETRLHAGRLVDDETETDVLLRSGSGIPVFSSRAGLEHHAQERRLALQDDLPDEIDLDLGGWLTTGSPQPPLAEVSELWHLLIDDPDAGRTLGGEALGEAYDDLVEEVPDWYDEHGQVARKALADAVRRLRSVLRPA